MIGSDQNPANLYGTISQFFNGQVNIYNAPKTP